MHCCCFCCCRRGDTYPGIRGATRCDVQIFTYIGPILVSCNPYKSLPIFNKDFIKLYYDRVSAVALGSREPRSLRWPVSLLRLPDYRASASPILGYT